MLRQLRLIGAGLAYEHHRSPDLEGDDEVPPQMLALRVTDVMVQAARARPEVQKRKGAGKDTAIYDSSCKKLSLALFIFDRIACVV